jgi:hypothetical protein
MDCRAPGYPQIFWTALWVTPGNPQQATDVKEQILKHRVAGAAHPKKLFHRNC